jgi:hypothetical protein
MHTRRRLSLSSKLSIHPGGDNKALAHLICIGSTNRIIFGPGLVSTTGVIHKRQRKLVNPIFSPSNLRELVPTFRSVAERVSVYQQNCSMTHKMILPKLTDVLANECRARGDSRGRTIIDMSEWMVSGLK